jgi:F-type H+-transporting ATPase subunit epsilon
MALQVILVSADAEVWEGEASLVVAKTVEGEIGFMAGHEPVLANLADDGQVRITQADGTKILASARDGFISMEGNDLTIVAGNAALLSE